MPFALPPDDPCRFCRYLAGTAPYTILERDETTAAFVTFEQRGQGHVLVIPIRHVNTIDLAPDEQWAVIDGVARVARAVLGAFDPSGVAVWQNNGMPAHQTVPHVHVHVAGTLVVGGTESRAVERLATSVTTRSPLEFGHTFGRETRACSFDSPLRRRTTPNSTDGVRPTSPGR